MKVPTLNILKSIFSLSKNALKYSLDLPKPSINRLIQHRLAEKDFVNKLNIRTTRYASIDNKSDIDSLEDLLPGILKTTTLGYDGKGQYPIKKIEDLNLINIDFSEGYILEKLVKLKKEISINNKTIIFHLDNELESSIFDDIKNKLQSFLKKKFKEEISIEKKVTIKEKEKTIYTNKDKFEYLIDKNKNLIELKNRLGLDYEF